MCYRSLGLVLNLKTAKNSLPSICMGFSRISMEEKEFYYHIGLIVPFVYRGSLLLSRTFFVPTIPFLHSRLY